AFEYNTDLFDGATIVRLADAFHTLLEGVVADPDARVMALPLVRQAERQRVLLEWNATARPFPDDVCIQDMVAARIAEAPDAVAATWEGQRLTYRELDVRANQLARLLARRGVGPEVPVAVLLDRSFDALVALLGILKAGGAYLPIDTA